MVRDFLRRPSTPLEWAADVVRVAGLVGVVVALIVLGPVDAGVAAIALPALAAPRLLAVRPGFDLAFGVTVLVAAWSNVLDLYRSVPGWDLLLHVVCTGALAVMLYLVLVRAEVVADPGTSGARRRTPMVIVPALALALGAVWEVVEWIGKTFVSDEIYVTYTDTIGDLVADGVGGLIAGLVVARVRLTRGEPVSAPRPRPRGRRVPPGEADLPSRPR